MVEIILDPSIRDWVVLPMVIIFGCSAMVRHYVTLLLKSEKMASVEQLMPMYVAPHCADLSVQGGTCRSALGVKRIKNADQRDVAACR